MPATDPDGHESLRAAEAVATLCLATDLGMGYPFEHGLHTTLIATRIAARLGAGDETSAQTFYASLLSHSGCTTDAHVTAEVFGGSLTERFNPVQFGPRRQMLRGILSTLPDPESGTPARAIQAARRLPRVAREQAPHLRAMCEVAEMLAGRFGLPEAITGLLGYLTDRWDGAGPLHRARGDEIPLPIRIVHVATDAALHRLRGDADYVARTVAGHGGHGLDPEIADLLAAEAHDFLAVENERSAWDAVLAAEPGPRIALREDEVDRALTAMAAFADLVSPYFGGHSTGVARLAGSAAEHFGMEPAGALAVRRAGLLHDLGRVAVGAAVWQAPRALTADEWEQVRLHPYHTERVLSRSAFFRALAPVASAHHERLDRSGYHRGIGGPDLASGARILAAADAYHAMCEPRPYRKRLTAGEAANELAREANDGRLDPGAVAAVTEAAGQLTPRLARPAGLTEREAQVLALLARGAQTKEVARDLGIAVKTADRHIQNAYAKIGVSTRAAATLFAIEKGLIAWGELPIAHRSERS